MALWLSRAGGSGEYERRFVEERRIYATWRGLNESLASAGDLAQMREILRRWYPDMSEGRLANHARQLLVFAKKMQAGDWVVTPSKFGPTVHVGEITGDYVFQLNERDPAYQHFREVRWIAEDVPRSVFGQDLLYSFSAQMTICRIRRNNAEERVRKLAASGWKGPKETFTPATMPAVEAPGRDDAESDDETGQNVDLAELARTQLAAHLIATFKGHGMARLVQAILECQGYTVYRPPEGPDGGVDLLAAPGELGFATPRICVQVKSGQDPVDRPTLDQLLGTMQNVHAECGLLVAWGGFKSSVRRVEATQFFRVRLWDQDDLMNAIFEHYERLPSDLRAELPLKRIWTLAGGGVDDEV